MMRRFGVTVMLMVSAATAEAGNLYGALIVAEDGTFLGTCSGAYGMDSIANDYGLHGSKYASQSMYNPYGQYGSPYATYSPFNRYGRPAYLLSNDPQLAALFTSPTYRPTPAIVSAIRSSGAGHVTVSTTDPRAVDPNVLRVACRNP